MSVNEYYKILGLNPGASIQEIKTARNEMLEVWHPDRFQHKPDLARKATEQTKKIINAYENLIKHLKNNQQSQTQSKKSNSNNKGKSDAQAEYKRRAEYERQQKEKAEYERQQKEKAEQERIAKERKAERERIAKEKAEQEIIRQNQKKRLIKIWLFAGSFATLFLVSVFLLSVFLTSRDKVKGSKDNNRAESIQRIQSVPVTSRPNCVVSYGTGVCWTISPPTTRCSGFPNVSPKVTISSDNLICTLVVPANSAQGVRAIDSSGQKFILEQGDNFEIVASGQVKFSSDHPCATPDGVRGWYDPNVDSPFNQNVGGLEFSIGNLKDNRFFAGSNYSGVVDSSGVPVFRIVEQIKGYSDDNSGAFTVTVKKIQ